MVKRKTSYRMPTSTRTGSALFAPVQPPARKERRRKARVEKGAPYSAPASERASSPGGPLPRPSGTTCAKNPRLARSEEELGEAFGGGAPFCCTASAGRLWWLRAADCARVKARASIGGRQEVPRLPRYPTGSGRTSGSTDEAQEKKAEQAEKEKNRSWLRLLLQLLLPPLRLSQLLQLSAQQLDEQRKLMRLMKLCLERSDASDGAEQALYSAHLARTSALPQSWLSRNRRLLNRPLQDDLLAKRTDCKPPVSAAYGGYSNIMTDLWSLMRGDIDSVSEANKIQSQRDKIQCQSDQDSVSEAIRFSVRGDNSVSEAIRSQRRRSCQGDEIDAVPHTPSRKGHRCAELRTLYCRCREFDYWCWYGISCTKMPRRPAAAPGPPCSTCCPFPTTHWLLLLPHSPILRPAGQSAVRSAANPLPTLSRLPTQSRPRRLSSVASAGSGRLSSLCGGGGSDGGLASHEVAACSALLSGRLLLPPGGVVRLAWPFRLAIVPPLSESRDLLRRLCASPGTPLAKCQLLAGHSEQRLSGDAIGRRAGEIGADDLVARAGIRCGHLRPAGSALPI
uniref:Uncharacterized protein n=1 Tax=Macrostomum lignano TaxID=282301 RepID=A0A1I8JR37_9PLAT